MGIPYVLKVIDRKTILIAKFANHDVINDDLLPRILLLKLTSMGIHEQLIAQTTFQNDINHELILQCGKALDDVNLGRISPNSLRVIGPIWEGTILQSYVIAVLSDKALDTVR